MSKRLRLFRGSRLQTLIEIRPGTSHIFRIGSWPRSIGSVNVLHIMRRKSSTTALWNKIWQTETQRNFTCSMGNMRYIYTGILWYINDSCSSVYEYIDVCRIWLSECVNRDMIYGACHVTSTSHRARHECTVTLHCRVGWLRYVAETACRWST